MSNLRSKVLNRRAGQIAVRASESGKTSSGPHSGDAVFNNFPGLPMNRGGRSSDPTRWPEFAVDRAIAAG